MARTVTISLSDEAFRDLQARVGGQDLSTFVEDLIRPHLVGDDALDAAYREMAADEEREREAREWIEADIGETLE